MCMNKTTYADIRKEKEKDTIVKTDQIPVHIDICIIIIYTDINFALICLL